MAKKKATKKKSVVGKAYVNSEFGNVWQSATDLVNERPMVVPISPAIDSMVGGGILEGTTTIISGQPKDGKCQPKNAKVYTPDGHVPIGSLRPGDVVCTPNGRHAKVQEVFPKPEALPVFTIHFENGDTAQCTDDHLWRVTDKKNGWQVLPLQDMRTIAKRWKYVQLTEPVKFKRQPLHDDPYEAGAAFSGKSIALKCPSVQYNHMYSTIEIRQKFLQGFLDRTAEVKKDTCHFKTIHEKLARQIKEMLQSFGAFVHITQFKDEYYVGVRYEKLDMLFTKPEKLTLIKSPGKKLHNKITKIVPAGKQEVVCIKIDSEDELYLTDNYIVTHNTSTALTLAANSQQEQYGWRDKEDKLHGREVFFYDIEGRLRERDILGIPGLDHEKFHIIKSTEEKVLTAEDTLNIAFRMMNDFPGSVHIFDSLSMLCTEKEMSNAITGSQMPTHPKVVSAFMRQIAGVIPVRKNIVVNIAHIITNIGGYTKWVEKTPQSVRYQADTRMRTIRKEIYHNDDDDPIGQKIEWRCEASPLSVPGKQCVSYLVYGEGLDKYKETVELAVEVGLIERGGSWYTMSFMDEPEKIQGMDNVVQYLKENSSEYDHVEKELGELV